MKRLDISKKKSGQIWIETVIYTLIGIAIIGLVLAVTKPKIDSKKDEIAIEQAMESLNTIDKKIYEVQAATGNRRSVDLQIGNGKFILDMENDKIIWELVSSFEYSEEDLTIQVGKINVTTEQDNPWRVTLEMDYDLEIYYDGKDDLLVKEIDAAPTPYRLTIENLGIDSNTDKLIIDIREA